MTPPPEYSGCAGPNSDQVSSPRMTIGSSGLDNWQLATAIAAFAMLVGLLSWQSAREREVRACVDAGLQWNGPQSRCEPPTGGPILQRDDLRRI
jgi:hypothetical protein